MGMITGVHHVSMKCCTMDQYEKTVAFYKDVLGLTVRAEFGSGILLDSGDGLIEIFHNGTELPGRGIIGHFAFRTDDVRKCIETVTNAGYEVFMGPKDATLADISATVAFCRGPLGEEIEFFQVNREGM